MIRPAWVALACAAAILTGCSAAVQGTSLPEPASTDPAGLVTGPYPRSPVPFTPSRTLARSLLPGLEARRMLNWLVTPSEIDPELNTPASVAFFSWAPGLEDVLPKYFVPVAEKHLFLMGVSTTRTNNSLRTRKRGISMVLRFPDDNFARAAAAEFGDVIKIHNPGTRDRPDALPGQPTAITTYNDGSPNINSFLPFGPFVIVTNIGMPTADYSRLAGQLKKLQDAQTSRLRGFQPTPLDDILDLPLNQDGMLELALPSIADSFADYVRDAEIGVYQRQGALVFEKDAVAAQTVFADAGVDLVARHSGVVYRARDSYGAVRVQAMLGRTAHRNDKVLAHPPGLPEGQCLEPAVRDVIRDRRYLCAVSHGRYAAVVFSQSLRDVWQKAAAQYSILAARQ